MSPAFKKKLFPSSSLDLDGKGSNSKVKQLVSQMDFSENLNLFTVKIVETEA